MRENLFISFEGVDGTGKTSLLRGVMQYLEAQGNVVVITREPGSALGGQTIRDMLFTDDPGPGAGKMFPGQADCLLLYDHIGNAEGIVRPALKEGKWVLSDRYCDSQWAYSVGKPHSKSVNEAYYKHFGPIPDITFLLIGDVAEFSARAKSRDLQPDAVDPGKQQRKIWADLAAQQRIQDAYLHQLSNQTRTEILDITGLDPSAVLALAIERLTIRLSRIYTIPVQAPMFESVQ